MSDDEIQDQIQRGETLPGREGEAYEKIFRALRREPDFVLPSSFADRVMHRLQTSSTKSNDVFWLYAGLTACMITLVVAVWLSGFTPKLSVPGFVRNYPGLILFGILFVMALQWLDRRLIKKPV